MPITASFQQAIDYTGNGSSPTDQIFCQSHDGVAQCKNADLLCDETTDCQTVSALPQNQHINDESFCDPVLVWYRLVISIL